MSVVAVSIIWILLIAASICVWMFVRAVKRLERNLNILKDAVSYEKTSVQSDIQEIRDSAIRQHQRISALEKKMQNLERAP